MTSRVFLLSSAYFIPFLSWVFKPVLAAASTVPLENLNGRPAFRKASIFESAVARSYVDDSRSTLAQIVGASKVQHAVLGLRSPEQRVHTGKAIFWPPDQGNGLVAWLFASVFVLLIASTPLLLHLLRDNAKCPVSLLVMMEGLSILIWLSFGLICFTQFVHFQSPHFGGTARSLTLVEAVYFFAQILTTVGYGDITPAHAGGQACVACFVMFAIILIAELVSELFTIVCERADKRVQSALKESNLHPSSSGSTGGSRPSFWTVLFAAFLFALMVFVGSCFFHLYPGEGKTWGEGVYMSIITLTTVGFGAFLPVTQAGMVFGAFWMVLGVTALGYLVSSFSEYLLAVRSSREQQDSGSHETLPTERADQPGRVDEVGFLQYKLVMNNHARKHDIDLILKHFLLLQRDRNGTVTIEQVKKMPELPVGHCHEHHHHGLHGGHHVHHS